MKRIGRKSPIKKIPSLRCVGLKIRCGLEVVDVGEGRRRRRGDVREQIDMNIGEESGV